MLRVSLVLRRLRIAAAGSDALWLPGHRVQPRFAAGSVGQAALFCDPADPRDIAAKLRSVLTTESLETDLREAGFARARSFSWSKSAAHLEQMLGAGPLRAAA